MKQKITGFHVDAENHWVAELDCGHNQHMRHDPPWMERPWVLTLEGRNSRLGHVLNCVRCDEMAEKAGKAVINATRTALIEAYEEGGMSGLCAEGRWDLALDALKKLDLKPALNKALSSDETADSNKS
jgi:uncharacterized protein DUF3565